MAAFGLVSQSLRTGEPLHHVLPHSLLDRLFYHHGHVPALAATTHHKQPDLKAVKAPNYMYYASAMIAVYQLLAVCLLPALDIHLVLILAGLVVPGRVARDHEGTVRGDTPAGFRELARGVRAQSLRLGVLFPLSFRGYLQPNNYLHLFLTLRELNTLLA